jgi:hypothetical protein
VEFDQSSRLGILGFSPLFGTLIDWLPNQQPGRCELSFAEPHVVALRNKVAGFRISLLGNLPETNMV